MADLDMFCNYGKCRKRLTHFAWVTSCSHAFCDHDGEQVFHSEDGHEYTAQPKKCPACQTPLTKSYDIIKVDLNPTEEFKSMVLAGLRPEILAEIVNRATTFWNYQIYQEYMFQASSANRSRERLASMGKHYESITTKMKADLQVYTSKLESAHKELESFARSTEELKERLKEKSCKAQKLQQMVDTMRRKTLTSHVQLQDKSPHNYEQRRVGIDSRQNVHFNFPYSSVGPQPQKISNNATLTKSTYNRPENQQDDADFSFRPVTPSPRWNHPIPARATEYHRSKMKQSLATRNRLE